MSQNPHSQAYIDYYKQGPFSGRIDPWAEQARYFHAIHGGMIDALLDAIQDKLIAIGYRAGRETSLQIVDNRQPDIYVQQAQEKEQGSWSYDAAATALQVEAGIEVMVSAPELDAILINAQSTGELVTVIEVISPRNKSHQIDMQRYIQQRGELFLAQGVNVVEIDCTRSVQRLLNHDLAYKFPYHTAIYMPGELPRLLVCNLMQAMKPFALPLKQEAIVVDPQPAYDRAYQRVAIAGKISKEHKYSPEALPFPSLLSEEQKQNLEETARKWQSKLEQLREDSP